MKYKCEMCNYETDFSSNWCIHKKSQKHISNESTKLNLESKNRQANEEKNICSFCGRDFAKKCYLTIHLKNCKEKMENDKKNEQEKDKVRILEEKNKKINAILEEKNREISKKYEEINFKNKEFNMKLEEKEREINRKNEEINKKNKELDKKDRQINKIIKDKKQEIENVTMEKNKEIEKITREKDKEIEKITKEKDKLINMLEKNMDGTQKALNTSVSACSYLTKKYTDAPALEPLSDYSVLEEKNKFAREAMYYQKKQKLNEYLGGFIVINYKKEDLSQQSIWNSDTVRLTYIIRESVNQHVSWSVDKKGIKVAKQIIDSMLIYVNTVMNEQLNYFGDLMNHSEEQNEYVENMMIISSIIHDIKTGDLKNNINKYIAPYFYLGKNENLITNGNEPN